MTQNQIYATIAAVTLVLLFIVSIFESGSTNAPNSNSSSSNREPVMKYCKYAGCTDPPSGFWAEGTGYCRRHAQQLLDEQKLIDKLKTQGY